MRTPKRLPVVLILGLSLALSTASASAAGSGPTTISGPSPYANCTIGGPGTNYPGAEVEPWVAVNPTTAGSNKVGVAAAWQQDRWSNGGSHGLVAGYSFDGGKSWGETPLPFSVCAPGGLNYERASDPWVSFGPDGTLYTVSISFNQSNNNNAVAAATSTDGGKTWSSPTVLFADTGTTQYFNDKESVTADPVHPGVAYVVWDRLVSPNGNPYADLHSFAYTGPTWFTRTADGGKSWSTPQIIVNTAQENQTIGNQIVVDPKSGTLYDFFNDIVSTGPGSHGYNVAFVKSADGGKTWSQPQIVATINYVTVTDPNTGATIRTGDIIPEPAIDPASGKLYVVWQDGQWSGGKYAEVALSASGDGGATWSTPVRVNTPTGRAAFTPSVRVAAGAVGVTYYDFRNLTSTNTTTLPTDYWFVSSSNGGQSFGGEQHLAGSFNMLTAPYAEGYFVGDYAGLDVAGSSFYSVFVQTTGNSADPTDVYGSVISP